MLRKKLNFEIVSFGESRMNHWYDVDWFLGILSIEFPYYFGEMMEKHDTNWNIIIGFWDTKHFYLFLEQNLNYLFYCIIHCLIQEISLRNRLEIFSVIYREKRKEKIKTEKEENPHFEIIFTFTFFLQTYSPTQAVEKFSTFQFLANSANYQLFKRKKTEFVTNEYIRTFYSKNTGKKKWRIGEVVIVIYDTFFWVLGFFLKFLRSFFYLSSTPSRSSPNVLFLRFLIFGE